MIGAVVTVGTFDGLHRGHQRVLAEVVGRARAGGLTSVLVLCEPHPLEVVNPAAAPKLLTLPDEKRELLAGAGLDRVVVLPFTREVAQQSPEEFIRGLRAEHALEQLVLGYDHAFGRGRAGDEALVRRLGAADGFAVAVVDAVKEDGQPISSTFAEQGRTLEVHLFDFAGELYGETVRVEWVERLRDVQAFPSRDALVAQLERDRQAARASLNR